MSDTRTAIAAMNRCAKAAEDAAAMLREVITELEQHQRELSRFHEGSASRTVAELLLDLRGGWVMKDWLAGQAGVTGSVVPRVVAKLRASGVEVERKSINGAAAYRVVPE